MKRAYFIMTLVVWCILVPSVYADFQKSVNDVVAQMTRELGLTDEQAAALKPIIKESLAKRQAFLEQEGNLFSNKKRIKAAMLKFREEEDRELSKVLSEEQMDKLIQKRNLRQSLNKDEVDFSDSLGSNGVGLEGATMAF